MFDEQNPQKFYVGQQMPKLSKAEVLFFGLIQSGAIKLSSVPMPNPEKEVCFVDERNPDVMTPLQHDLELLSSLYEQCRRFAARHEKHGGA